MVYVDYRDWAVSNKSSAVDIARRYGGDFSKAMVEAFAIADSRNTRALLNSFEDIFIQLYSFYLAEEKSKAVAPDILGADVSDDVTAKETSEGSPEDEAEEEEEEYKEDGLNET